MSLNIKAQNDFLLSNKAEEASNKNETLAQQSCVENIIVSSLSKEKKVDVEKRNDNFALSVEDLDQHTAKDGITNDETPEEKKKKSQEEIAADGDNSPMIVVVESSIQDNEYIEDFERSGLATREVEELSNGSGIYDDDFHENESNHYGSASAPNDMLSDNSASSNLAPEFKYMSNRLVNE